MDQTKRLPQKTTSSVLSKALQSNDTSLAIRELSATSIGQIMNARELRLGMEEQLESLRNSYKFFKNNKDVKDRVKHMATLKKLGNELNKELQNVPSYPTLFELRGEREDETLRVMKLLIVSIIEYHHTSEIMSTNMIEEVALRILFQFGGLTLEDIALCFHQIKNGTRGKVYNRIDAQVIMLWLHDYQKDLQEIGTERNARLHNQEKTGVWKDGQEYRIVDYNRQQAFDLKGHLAEGEKRMEKTALKMLKELM